MRDGAPVSGLQEPAASLICAARRTCSHGRKFRNDGVQRNRNWPGIAAILPEKGRASTEPGGLYCSGHSRGPASRDRAGSPGHPDECCRRCSRLKPCCSGPFSFRTRLLEKDGVPVKLGGRATDILRLLVSRAGEVIPKDEILAYAWSGLVVEEISLRVHIAELRKALGDGKDGARYITNVPSRGYCFVAPVQRSIPKPTSPSPVASETSLPASLPHRLERMVGRDEVLQELSARLLSDRFITLRGPGGIGKTTVAVGLAHDMLTVFDGHVHFLDLAPLRDATLVASTVATALGLVVHHADPTESVISFLRDRRLLLVIDSCEHVIEVVARLAEGIYQQAPDVSILATSREFVAGAG